MRGRTRFRRGLLRAVAVLLALGALWPGVSGAAEQFPPEDEAKIKAFLGRVSELRTKTWTEAMEKEAAEVAKVTSLDADGQKALLEPAQKAVRTASAAWMEKMTDFVRRILSVQREQIPLILDQFDDDSILQTDVIYDYTPPMEQPAWTEALHLTLSPGQGTAWDKASSARQALAVSLVEKFLKPRQNQARMMYEAPLLARAAHLKMLLGLPKERADRLEAVVKTVSEGFVATWRKRLVRTVLAMTDAQRQAFDKNRSPGVGISQETSLAGRLAWETQTLSLLTPEEIEQWKGLQKEHRARRVRVLAQVMLAELDQRLALTSRQREQLQPLAERLVQADTSLVADEELRESMDFSVQNLTAAAAKANDAELAPILDPQQREHWKQLADPESESLGQTVMRRRAVPAKSVPAAKSSAEPEEFEEALSDFFYEKTGETRRHLLRKLLLQVEDANRVTPLSSEVVGRLRTAARGAAEASLVDWKHDTDVNIRQNLGEVNLQSVRQRLAGMQDYSMQRESGPQADQQRVWKMAVSSELTEAQRNAWQVEVDARAAYRAMIMSGAVLSELDRRIMLTTEQWTALDARLTPLLKSYGEDLSNQFSYNGPWYLQSFYAFTPLAGIPEKELTAILSKEQMNQWKGCQEFSVANSYWNNIQQMHANRARR